MLHFNGERKSRGAFPAYGNTSHGKRYLTPIVRLLNLEAERKQFFAPLLWARCLCKRNALLSHFLLLFRKNKLSRPLCQQVSESLLGRESLGF